MLTTLETSLLKAVAFDPNNAKLIVSPQSIRLREWVSSPLAVKVFSAIAELVLSNKTVSIVSIGTHPKISTEELRYLAGIWNEGKTGSTADVSVIVETLRNEFLVRESEKEMERCRVENRKDISKAVPNLVSLSSILGSLAHDGTSYNPDPVSHLDDPEVTVTGSWHCRILDDLFDGGIPNGGYSLCVAPTGFGKTTLSKSYVVYSIISQRPVSICTNEMQAGDISRGVKRALMAMYAVGSGNDEKSESDIERDMRMYMRVFDKVFEWERLASIACTERPEVLVIDSLDNLTFPPESRMMPIDEKHKARANGIAGLSLKYGSFTSVVGNASGDQQNQLREGVERVSSARAFGSAWYENMSSWSSVMSRDKVQLTVSHVRRCKNRRTGRIGEIWDWQYDSQGAYYKDSAPVSI